MRKRTPILVIDDERDFLDLVEYNLRLAGFDVHLAASGPEGLREADAMDPPPEVILLDTTMPDMDGLEVLSEFKHGERTHEIPVFMLTARTIMGDVERAFEVGADDYIPKPVELTRLGQIVRRKLEKARLRAR